VKPEEKKKKKRAMKPNCRSKMQTADIKFIIEIAGK
jgi:hypothetical protein